MALLKSTRCLRTRPPQLAGAAFRRNVSQLSTVDERFDRISVDRFREATDNGETPLALLPPQSHGPQPPLPSVEYCIRDPDRIYSKSIPLTDRLSMNEHLLVRYELVTSQPCHEEAISDFFAWLESRTQHGPKEKLLYEYVLPLKPDLVKRDGGSRFHQFVAPLALILRAAQFNQAHPSNLMRSLYITQHPISDLPEPFRDDLPAPRLVKQAGDGDIYGTSIWMGLEPTNTPLHRDPNPNLFVQLRNEKVIRMMPPREGAQLFRKVQSAAANRNSGRMRGTEMMTGPESEVMHERVWREKANVLEARVGPGGAVYIPLRWWHSVRSVGEDGDLNASVNWWFR